MFFYKLYQIKYIVNGSRSEFTAKTQWHNAHSSRPDKKRNKIIRLLKYGSYSGWISCNKSFVQIHLLFNIQEWIKLKSNWHNAAQKNLSASQDRQLYLSEVSKMYNCLFIRHWFCRSLNRHRVNFNWQLIESM